MIRVVIERRIKPGKEREMWSLLHDLRSQAMRQPGYVSGETLVGTDDPALWVVISSWLKPEYWQSWSKSPERQGIASAESGLLSAPVKTAVLKFLEEPGGSEDEPVGE
ncbi:MAG: antibiotic biosynthesis monooxygenase [Chloroflexi bacterium]|nr:antibiotic biosynthesis monooxygenase [Chloroflexota bacterium]